MSESLLLWVLLLLPQLLLAFVPASLRLRQLGRALLSITIIALGVSQLAARNTGNSEAWLIMSAAPLFLIGFLAYHRVLGKWALGLGVILSLALCGAWWNAVMSIDEAARNAATILYSVLVLAAFVAWFMLGGVVLMHSLVDAMRRQDQRNAEAAAGQAPKAQ